MKRDFLIYYGVSNTRDRPEPPWERVDASGMDGRESEADCVQLKTGNTWRASKCKNGEGTLINDYLRGWDLAPITVNHALHNIHSAISCVVWRFKVGLCGYCWLSFR